MIDQAQYFWYIMTSVKPALLDEVYRLQKTHAHNPVTLTLHLALSPQSTPFTSAFIESAFANSLGSMHGTVGGQLLGVTVKSMNPYAKTVKIMLDDIAKFDQVWMALAFGEGLKGVRYKVKLQEIELVKQQQQPESL